MDQAEQLQSLRGVLLQVLRERRKLGPDLPVLEGALVVLAEPGNVYLQVRGWGHFRVAVTPVEVAEIPFRDTGI